MTERPRVVQLYAPMVATMLVVIVLDQLTKHWATGLDLCRDLVERPTVGFCLAHNKGMAFSVGWGAGKFISAVALTIVVVLFVAARKLPLSARILMGAIAGGALGNVIDRAFRSAIDGPRTFMGGAVVDFIYSTFWATFNVADSAVVVGGILLSILLWRLPEPGDEPPAPVGADAGVVAADGTLDGTLDGAADGAATGDPDGAATAS